ncbi:uncharacterized protein [Coffea arabica]|uniref:Uncharacterized protein isoform X1 n=1 Tax=Coffea arabica TaxID=13443 RepID=A0ABM4WKY5_COFAR|nr:uncharacterized protein LOC113727756 isoform X1 [Coffea arabica]
MGRGGKVGFKQGSRRRVRRIDEGSDESDEDYIVGEDEGFDESEEEEFVDEDESEDSLGEFEEEEEDEEEEFVQKKLNKVKKVGRPKKRFPRKNQNGAVKPKTKKRVSYSEEDECDDSDEYVGGRRNEIAEPRKKKRTSYREQDDDNYDDLNEEDDDYDDDDDEEFTLDEIHDDVDDEDVMVERKKNKKLGRPRMPEKRISKGQKRKRNTKVSKKMVRKKQRENHGLPRKSRHNTDGDFRKSKTRLVEKNKKITGRGGRRRVLLDSDSDFVNSGLSDYEYTISEEEREQVREANEFCRSLTTTLRSSTPVKKSREDEESVYPQRKRLVRKGKEKEEDLKIETGKQVCGICLSEEGKRTVRGTLNCCSHYFCFACIIEWSKVESRCPLCKQRFATISKPARSDTGFELRTMIIQIPERDQVYQPSEEELRGYLDPYENVICTECNHGGDDALMLLCDLCDSPAHTYCVGLGREVPEGNWYCEGCRPTALDSLNPQGLNPTPNHRTSNSLAGVSSPITTVRETFDLNEAYVPDTPLTQVAGQPSPRLFGADFQATSPASGSGAFTLYERRRIQRQIHQIFSNRRQQDTGINGIRPTVSGNGLFGSQVGRIRELAPQHAVVPDERIASHITFQGRVQDTATHLVQNRDAFPPIPTHLRAPVTPSQASTSGDGSFGGSLQNGFPGFNTRNSLGSGHQQIHPCNGRSNIGSDANLSLHQCREVSPRNVGKEQVQSMVKSHLKSLSRELELDYSTFKDVARSSTHTILAACGLEHRLNEVYPMQALLICSHAEQKAGGQSSPSKDHCSSCFDLLVRNVVRERMSTRVALSSKGSIQLG